MDGDEGFEAFVSARWTRLVATAYLVTGDLGIAEDCVQEALVRMHRRWRRVRPEGRVAYANRAVVNAALSWRRRRRVTEVPLEGQDRAQVDGGSADVDAQLLGALWTLPPRMRAAVVLRVLQDRSETETAEILGCSVGTVKSSTSRGLARLREVLGSGGARAGAVTDGRNSGGRAR